MVIQLPYVIKTEAEEEKPSNVKRISRNNYQIKYGIEYIDGTEKITQLNRPVENNQCHNRIFNEYAL